jgi:hypothetical protein
MSHEVLTSNTPPIDAVNGIESGVSRVTRRVELYESDGETPWEPSGDPERTRLVDGSVSIDYNRNERRTFDLTLDNEDYLLDPKSDGFWYDKRVKVFRGVRYPRPKTPPKMVIIEAQSDAEAHTFRKILSQLGFSNVDVNRSATTYEEVADYEYVISYMGGLKTAKSALLKQVYGLGKKVITVGNDTTSAEVPFITTTTTISAGSAAWGFTPVANDNPTATAGWGTETASTDGGQAITGYANSQAIPIARFTYNSTSYWTALFGTDPSSGQWFHSQTHAFGTQGKIMLKAMLDYMWDWKPFATWETQLGEYMIDKIDDSYDQSLIKCSGRDLTKRCLTSKLERSMSFPPGTYIYELIRSLAANAGIRKMKIPFTNETLGSTLDLERGTERWEVMKQAANSNNYDIYFDNQGFLTTSKFADPATQAPMHTFRPGLNLVTFNKSVNDSRLYNHVVVFGDREAVEGGEILMPYFGEAKNTDPASPTNIDRIGDRYYSYASSFFTADYQCQQLAENWLKIYSLESYEINWTSFNDPWLDVGRTVQVVEPRATDSAESKFLLDTMTFPLTLDPMSATGKRILITG